MIIDVHNHYLPRDAVRRLDNSPVKIEQVADGRYRVVAGTQEVMVDERLIDLDVQRADMDRQGVDQRAVMLPPFCLLYELPAVQGQAWARSVNDSIAEAVDGRSGDFIGFATVPLRDIEFSLEELVRAKDQLGLRGVEIATSVAGTGLDDSSLEPFWSTCQELQLVVLIHPHYVSGQESMGQYHLRNLIGNPAETALAGAQLMFSGVLERFPGLRLILSHGGGALPHLVGRLAHGFSVRPECRENASSPIESLRHFYYDTIVFDSVVLRHVVDHVGASQLVLGTDYPFDMSEDDPVGFIRRSGLADETQEQILSSGERLFQHLIANEHTGS